MKFSLQNKTAIHNETNKWNIKSQGFWLELPLLYATELCGTFCKPPCWPLLSPHPCTLILSFSAQLVTFHSFCDISQSVASNNISPQISSFLSELSDMVIQTNLCEELAHTLRCVYPCALYCRDCVSGKR